MPTERRWPDHRPEPEEETPLARLVVQLRGMRFGLMRYSTGDLSSAVDAEDRLSMLLERYDSTLVRVAVLLDVELPSQPDRLGERRRLTDEWRADLEEALRAAGINV